MALYYLGLFQKTYLIIQQIVAENQRGLGGPDNGKTPNDHGFVSRANKKTRMLRLQQMNAHPSSSIIIPET